VIILLGVAGSGKSEQGRLLADEYGYAWISTGEILRVLITGKRRHEMLAGRLLSDEEMIQIMDKILDVIDTNQEFILAGFPRTIPQTDWLLKQVEKGRFKHTAVIHLTASEKILRERLKSRGRLDDTDDAINQRFSEYQAVTRPIIDHFRKEQIQIYDIDGANTPRQVHEQIMKVVRKNSIE
jgi:adenylate kinase